MASRLDEILAREITATFSMSSVQTMVSRKSSITNAFVNAIVPTIPPSAEEIHEALSILGMEPSDVRCAYCGDKKTEWDHLRPIVVRQRPTGFISEIANLVPSCGKCNQSKRNVHWREWMLSGRGRSPSARKISDLEARVIRLEAYEKWRVPTKMDFEAIIGTTEWEAYWQLWTDVNDQLRKCQAVADSLRKLVAESLNASHPPMLPPGESF
jgi:HNH endonuclease